MREADEPNESTLARLRRTAKVKRSIERLFRRDDSTRTTEASQGRHAIADELRLGGWSKARRVVVLRRRIWHDVRNRAQLWRCTVPVTNVAPDITAIGPPCRDRCVRENGFDELKNQLKNRWAWGGFTMHRSQVTAPAVAMVRNGWSGCVRAAHAQARRDAPTSWPPRLGATE